MLKGHTNNRAGAVTLTSADATQTPDIRFRYLDEGSPGGAADLQGVIDGIRLARDIAAQLGAPPVAREVLPGQEFQTDAQLAQYVRDVAWGHHACGTARIGRLDDPDAVLDGDFRVRGTEHLRVVDASVFPDIPGFFIASAVYLISEKASDAVLRDHPSSGP